MPRPPRHAGMIFQALNLMIQSLAATSPSQPV
jgi:hypothetical protein